MVRRIMFPAVALAAVLGLVTPAMAQGFNESFDYAAGTLQSVSGGNWSSVNTGDDILVVDGNLTVSGLNPPVGRQVQFAGAGLDYNRSLGSSVNTGEFFYSFALRVDDMTGVTDVNGGYFMGFIQGNLPTGTSFGATVWARRVTDSRYNLGIEIRTATGASTTWDSSVLNTGDTQFVVASYEFVGGASNDVARLWVNPDSATFGAGSAPTPSVSDTHLGADLTDLGRLFLRQDSTTETGAYTIDEIRTGGSWAQVTPVPEPTTLLLGGIGMASVAYARRRQMAKKSA